MWHTVAYINIWMCRHKLNPKVLLISCPTMNRLYGKFEVSYLFLETLPYKELHLSLLVAGWECTSQSFKYGQSVSSSLLVFFFSGGTITQYDKMWVKLILCHPKIQVLIFFKQKQSRVNMVIPNDLCFGQ